MICGFPGEREEDHAELVAFLRQFRFQRLGAFAYSEEDGTPAAAYPQQIPPSVREARRDEIVALQQRIQTEFAEARVGTEVQLLIDSLDPEEPGVFIARSALEAPDCDPVRRLPGMLFSPLPQPRARLSPRLQVVFVHNADGCTPLAPGQLRLCRITAASLFDLVAHPID